MKLANYMMMNIYIYKIKLIIMTIHKNLKQCNLKNIYTNKYPGCVLSLADGHFGVKRGEGVVN